MTENKHEVLDEELNGVAEYAGLPYVFEVEPAENPQQSIVKIRGIKETWLVDTKHYRREQHD